MSGEILALAACVAALSALAAFLALSGGPARRRAAPAPGRLARRIFELPLARRAREAEMLAQRRSSCLSELPVLIDIVTLGLSAGLSFDSALELYCERYDNALSQAFGEAMLSWRIGARTREEALCDLADELGVEALRRFASVVAEALSFGSPLAAALERQAQAIREERRSKVEEQIEKVPVKMLVPLGTLIVPAMFLAILGPLLGSALVVG